MDNAVTYPVCRSGSTVLASAVEELALTPSITGTALKCALPAWAQVPS